MARNPMRVGLLVATAVLMVFAALGETFAVLPDLRGDLIEIGVRPTVLGGTLLRLYYSAIVNAGIAVMVCLAAIEAMRGRTVPRMPLAIVAAIEIAFGALAFSRTHSPHHFAPVLIGLLLAAALVVRDPPPGVAATN